MFEESYFDHHIERTGTGCVKYDLRSNFFERDDILPMWVADMDFRTPPFIIEKIRERLDHEVLAYTFRTPSFGKAVKRWMETRHHWNIEENWVTYSPGVVPALNMCVLAYTQPGDKIIVQPPVYFPFFSAIKDHDRIMVENPLVLRDGAYRMDLDHLRSVIDDSVKMIFLCSPHNPVGRVWTKEELIGLSEICLDHNIIIISDEIHHDLIFEGYSHFPTAKISKYISEMTVTCIAPSKTFNLAGMSTSALIIENDHLRSLYDAVLNKFHLNLGNIFGNVALEAAYNYGDEWITGLMKYIKGNTDMVRDFLMEHNKGIRLIEPEATYLLWLDFRDLRIPSRKVNELLIHNARIGLSDGRTFGRGGEGFQRMNVALPRDILSHALERIRLAF